MTDSPSSKTSLVNLINDSFGDPCHFCDSFEKSLLLISAFHFAGCFSHFFAELLCAECVLARLCLLCVSGYRFESCRPASLPFDALAKLGFASRSCALSESSSILLLYLCFSHSLLLWITCVYHKTERAERISLGSIDMEDFLGFLTHQIISNICIVILLSIISSLFLLWSFLLFSSCLLYLPLVSTGQ